MADPSAADRAQAMFGRIAVERGFVTQQQLDQMMRLHQQLGGQQPLGSLFIQRGLLSLGQVQEILAHQKQAQAEARLAPPRPAAPLPAPPPAAPPRPVQRASTGPIDPFAPDTDSLFGESKPAIRPALPVENMVRGAGDHPARMGAVADVGPRPASPAGRFGPPVDVVRHTPNLEDDDSFLRPIESTMPPPQAAPPPPPRPAAVQAPNPSAFAPPGKRVLWLIEEGERRHASDVHFHGATPPAMRINGVLGLLTDIRLDPKDQERELVALLTEEQRRAFEDAGELDIAYVTASGVRTRANIYRSHAGIDATFRILPRGPQSLEELNLPPTLPKLTAYHQGLVLVTGPAGSGKSTTLAALVNLLNAERPDHILLLEDPIEIIHPAKRALVNQRQVGRDTESFARALRGALREDPDIIVIGDLRDRETISLAITAAETGHLVIGSMNTNSAGRTVGRLIDAFPPVQQGQVRAMLSESLRGVASQKLIMGVDGKRVPAVELLIVTPAIGNLMRDGKLFQIRSQMQTGRSIGMRTMDEALRELVVAGKVDGDEARKHAENPAAIPSSAAPPPAAQGTALVPPAGQPAPVAGPPPKPAPPPPGGGGLMRPGPPQMQQPGARPAAPVGPPGQRPPLIPRPPGRG